MRLSRSVYFYPAGSSRGWEEEEINSNTIVIDGSELMIIDPGLNRRWPALKAKISADGLDPGRIRMVVGTHGHPDHLEAARSVVRECGAKLFLSQIEADFIEGPGQCFFRESGGPAPPRPAGFLMAGPQILAGHEFNVLPAPGHSPGGICLHFPAENILVTGDVYFAGTIGGIDFVGGCPADMYDSVAALERLEDVETVLCGHGPAISGRSEVAANYRLLNEEIARKKAAGIL